MLHTFSLDPRDVLFFRDARPMGGADAGLGARLPRPDQLHAALMSAFLAQWPDRQSWEGPAHTFGHGAHDHNRDSSCRFGALRVVGPFVADKTDTLYVPTPLDLGMRLVPLGDGTNLPAPLTMGFLPETREKRIVPPWIPRPLFQAYLAGKAPSTDGIELPFAAERTVQTAIDPATGTADEGRFFQAEYLRLSSGARLVFSASCVVHPKGGGSDVDVFAHPDAPRDIQIGGQGGLAYLRPAPDGRARPSMGESSAASSPSRFLRWTLLSPALFHAGWRPGWIDATSGRVMLRQGDTARREGESRAAWRSRLAQAPGFPTARLVAARVGKPVAFSGWDAIASAPKPTSLAVPAGSCYVFECGSTEEASALAAALDWPRPHSDLYGEKGFGIGICSFLHI